MFSYFYDFLHVFFALDLFLTIEFLLNLYCWVFPRLDFAFFIFIYLSNSIKVDCLQILDANYEIIMNVSFDLLWKLLCLFSLRIFIATVFEAFSIMLGKV